MNTGYDLNMDDLDNFPSLQKINRNERLLTLPEGYFEAFSERLLLRIRLEKIKSKETFSLPEHYFPTFSDRLLEKIREYEGMETPLLDSISRKNVYSVPENYFDNLSGQVAAKVDDASAGAKIIPLRSIRLKRNSWRMGVAAAVISAIVLGAGFILENGHKVEKQHTEYAGVVQPADLSQLSSEAIADYLSLPDGGDEDSITRQMRGNEDQQLNAIPHQDVENYLENTPVY